MIFFVAFQFQLGPQQIAQLIVSCCVVVVVDVVVAVAVAVVFF